MSLCCGEQWASATRTHTYTHPTHSTDIFKSAFSLLLPFKPFSFFLSWICWSLAVVGICTAERVYFFILQKVRIDFLRTSYMHEAASMKVAYNRAGSCLVLYMWAWACNNYVFKPYRICVHTAQHTQPHIDECNFELRLRTIQHSLEQAVAFALLDYNERIFWDGESLHAGSVSGFGVFFLFLSNLRRLALGFCIMHISLAFCFSNSLSLFDVLKWMCDSVWR